MNVRHLLLVGSLTTTGFACAEDRFVAAPVLPTAPVVPTSPPPRIAGGGGVSRFPHYTDFGECSALLDHLRTEAGERVTEWGLQPRWADTGIVLADAGVPVPTDAPAALPAAAPPTAAPTADASSGTNTQEVGVDEGDLAENDGRHVYLIINGALTVIDVQSGEQVTLEGFSGANEMILAGDRLVITSNDLSGIIGRWPTGAALPSPAYRGAVEESVIVIVDVAEPMAPRELRRTHVEARVTALRGVGDRVWITLGSALGGRLDFVTPAAPGEFGEVGRTTEELAEANRSVVQSSTIEDWLPRRFDVAPDGSRADVVPAIDCSTVGAPDEFGGFALSWLASVDLAAEEPALASAAGVIAQSETVYATEGSLYVATHNWGSLAWQPSALIPPAATTIHRFDVSANGSAAYQGGAVVEGRLLSAYSLSEHDEVLRVAVTDDNRAESFVHTYRPMGDELVKLGSVGGLGKNEQIYAVRFAGPVAYVVTFRQTDPLYVVDLADPATPMVRGELKIPGYSSYLHPIGDGRVIGLGQDADQSGSVLGSQVSLFDVSDPTKPLRLAQHLIGGSAGEAEYDPRAFLYWPATGDIIVPVASYTWVDETQIGSGGVRVIRLVKDGFVDRGAVARPATEWTVGEQSCGYFPFESASVRRSMIVAGALVTISTAGVQVSDLESLNEQRWIPLATAPIDPAVAACIDAWRQQ